MQVAIMNKLQKFIIRHKSKFTLISFTVFLTASIISSGIFFILAGDYGVNLYAFVISQIVFLALAIAPLLLMARTLCRTCGCIKDGIEKLGKGRLAEAMKMGREEMYCDVGNFVEKANHDLNDKLLSIARNANRLVAVEEELSSRFRPRNSTDNYTRQLVYRLKICTSRLQNDLSDFALTRDN